MKKTILLASLLILVSCANTGSNVDSGSVDSNSTSLAHNSNNVDYSLFDTNLIGTWYVHSNMMDILPLNSTFEIFENYTLIVQNIKFNFVGVYAGYEGTCEFLSESGITTFIVSYDGQNVDWAFEDTAGQKDMGLARNTPLSSGLNYDYVGTAWPMELINDYLEIKGNIPSYPSDCYYLYNSTSIVYDDAKSAMIDIFDATNDSAERYIELLEKNGFTITGLDGMGFYVGYDQNHIYSLRIKYFGNNNLSIFIYNYATLFK
ncbi:MAG: hypothetical protein J1F32_02200 [Erysipelotrichales bacterium]|nr:hypothetical protein [Erysipelotrichales bacterium]